MRVAIELRHCTGRPVLMMEEGRMIGVIGDDEIYRGLMSQGSAGAHAAVSAPAVDGVE